MKQISLLIVLVISFIPSYGQFGIKETTYLNGLKEESQVSLIIKGDLEKIKEACAQVGANYKYGYQNLAAVSIEKEKLGTFYQILDGSQIEIPLAKASILMDTALIHNNIVQVHSGMSPLLQGYTGKGVIVGILDSGIYFEHDDFKNADGTTRIKFIWDQNISNPTNSPAPYNYGDEWSWIDINNGACNHVEPANQFGHGTTVAGAACGNGLATGQYKGVAPDCDIIAVAVDYYGSDFLTKTVDAIDYVFKKADALGKPCVINTSFGTYTGSHDGKDLASQLIDALLEERPGRALVSAAGNGNNINNTESNFFPTHLAYTLSADTNFTWFRTYSSSSQVYFELWADQADFQNAYFSIGNDKASSYAPGGRTDFLSVQNFLGNLSQGDYLNRFVFDANGNAQGQVEMYLEIEANTYHLEVLITPINTSDLWRFSTTGFGTFDIWSSANFHGTSNMVYSNLPPNFVVSDIDYYKLPDNKKSIVSSWNCSDKVISVGNYANQRTYLDVDSLEHDLGLNPGEIYYKSSEGPSRDNRLKPDLSATGNIIFASGNATFVNSALNINRPKVAPGGKHNYNGGTSMSAPIVAGAIALYLEKNPNAWWYEIKEALIQSALKDSYTGPSSNTVYGNGKLNGFNLLQFDAVLGCMDSSSFNFNPLANVEDGSCIPVILGCTDSASINFNSSANTNDGSCIPIVYGCTDSLALNYNSLANVEDGTCTYPVDTTGLKMNFDKNLFTLQPNPASSDLLIQLDLNENIQNLSLVIFDILGKKVLEIDIEEESFVLNIAQLESGSYFVHLYQARQWLSGKKLIKE